MIRPNEDVDTEPLADVSATCIWELLAQDLDKDGDQKFIPFFATKDLLVLSTCCKSFDGFRYHLTEVAVKQRGDPDQGREGAVRLVQQQTNLTRLTVLDSAGVSLVEDVGETSVDYLEFDVSGEKSSDQSDYWCGAAGLILEGVVKDFRTLCLDGPIRTEDSDPDISNYDDYETRYDGILPEAYNDVLAALCDRSWPQLEELHLYLSHLDENGEEDSYVTQAMVQGHLPNLKVIKIGVQLTDYGSIITAASQGHCPKLEILELPRENLNRFGLHEDIQELITGNMCPKLRDFELVIHPSMEDFTALFQSLASHPCPFITKIASEDMDDCDAYDYSGNDSSFEYLAEAIERGHLPNLEIIDLSYCFILSDCLNCPPPSNFPPPSNCPHRHATILRLIRSFKNCHRLTTICLAGVGLREEHGLALSSVIRESKVKWNTVRVSENISLGDGGLVPIISALQELKYNHFGLNLRGTGLGVETGRAIVRSLQYSHSLCNINLEKLGGSGDWVGDDTLTEIVAALRHHQRLTRINISSVGFGEKAGAQLVQNIASGAWPNLTCLIIKCRPQDGYWSGRGLVNALRSNSKKVHSLDLVGVELDAIFELSVALREQLDMCPNLKHLYVSRFASVAFLVPIERLHVTFIEQGVC